MPGLREAFQELGLDLGSATVAIQGYGNAGKHAHKIVTTMLGSEVVAVTDREGGLYCPAGLEFELVRTHKRLAGTVTTFCSESPIPRVSPTPSSSNWTSTSSFPLPWRA